MSETTETVEGVVDVPDEEAAEARAELERVERDGLLPARREDVEPVTYRQAIELGHVLAASGYFKDATGAAQAAVKVMVGAELGFSPMASIMGVHVIEGRPAVGGRLLGAIVKNAPGWDFTYAYPVEVERQSDGLPTKGECTVTVIHDGVPLDPVSFTVKDASLAGLLKAKGNWAKYPRKMLYWRALSNAVDFHCPHLLGGLPLVAEEDAADDARAPLVAELSPPAQRPPALADDEAEELRAAAQAAYDRLRPLNPTLITPAKFANQIANAEHSHERLRQVVAAFEDLADTEAEIVAATDKLTELAGSDVAADELSKAMAKSSRAEVRDALQAAVNRLLDDDGAAA